MIELSALPAPATTGVISGLAGYAAPDPSRRPGPAAAGHDRSGRPVAGPVADIAGGALLVGPAGAAPDDLARLIPLQRRAAAALGRNWDALEERAASLAAS